MDYNMNIQEIHNISSVELFERFFYGRPFCFLLDSAMDPGKLGRFSFMGAEPFLIVKSKGRLIELIDRVQGSGFRVQRFIGNPFEALKELLAEYRSDFYHDEIPFLGGAVGYFSYDLCHFLEELPSTAIDDIDAPDMWVGFYDEIVAVDNARGKAYSVNLVSCPRKRASRNKAIDCRFRDNDNIVGLSQNIKSNFLKESYCAAINRAKEYIRQGDIYQVNLSQRFMADLAMPPFELYKRLRQINPAPFAAYLDCGDTKIISASPERFLKIDAKSRYIQTRPIKGTRPRGKTPIEDERFKNELVNSAKDRAEHIMIVDLERNDLGRVCEYGSVKWSEQMALEEYATVSHLVSTVSGRLRSDVSAVDCLMNCFPGGSITGAPKIRAMEIIDELEPTKRSAYTGAIGYIGFNGNMDTNIVIRSFINKGDKLYFQVGGGIVADSDPEAEYQETLDKARALMEAIGVIGHPLPYGERVGVRGNY
jgi:para-aminobenzoate synthetase component 1